MNLRDTLDYYDTPDVDAFNLPPERAIEFFRNKGLRTSFRWQDVSDQEHRNAFTIAKMADIDLLADVQASLQRAIADGIPYQQWADDLIPTLQARGWWGRKAVVYPATGQTVVAQLGSPARLQTIYRTNLQSAYAVGQWEAIQENIEAAPYLLYDAIDDHRTRPEHAAWDGTILRADHPWWKTHYPPNGWNCRCGVVQLSADEIEELGLTVTKRAPASPTTTKRNPRTGAAVKVPDGIDQGWQSPRGTEKARSAELAKVAQEKIGALPTKTMQEAAAAGMRATRAQASRTAPGEAPAAAQLAWQPSMQASDAKRWAEGTATPGTYLHYSKGAAQIQKKGFDLRRVGEGAGAAFGTGVYLVPSTDTAASLFYRNLIGANPIEAVAKVVKPHTVRIDSVVLGQPMVDGAAIRVAPSLRLDPLKLAVLDGIPNAERKLRRAIERSNSLDEAITMVLLGEGFDAVIIQNAAFAESVGGTQLIVLDPQKIVAINPRAKPAKRTPG